MDKKNNLQRNFEKFQSFINGTYAAIFQIHVENFAALNFSSQRQWRIIDMDLRKLL